MQLLKRPASISQEESGLFLTMGIIIAILILLLAFGCQPAKKNTTLKNNTTDYLEVLPPVTSYHEEADMETYGKMNEERVLVMEAPEEELHPGAVETALDIPGDYEEKWNTEEYDFIRENGFKQVFQEPVSTFSIDVDNASYSNMRRYLNAFHQLPPKDAVRIEELINYFDYRYPDPAGEHPFMIITEVGECPWNRNAQLVHIGIQGKRIDYEEVIPSNLTFLIDVSGSMDEVNKLELVKKSMRLMISHLSPTDKIAMVVYAGSAGLVLPSTSLKEKSLILKAIDELKAGGSTAGGEGIRLAYDIAVTNKIEGGNNRVILATDGDFNVGVSSTSELVRLIEEKRTEGVYLTICGFGMGNYKDGRMEQISNAGNGNYFYIDNIREAEKVFVRELRANLFTIAGDVKIQVEFNPLLVKAYRLIGYENRILNREDFEDDTKDAGELGAGHSVTCLYEIVRNEGADASSERSRYLKSIPTERAGSDELMTLNLRYKPVGSESSKLIVQTVQNHLVSLGESSHQFRFSAAVAGFGLLLRNSEFKNELTYDQVLALAELPERTPEDPDKREFLSLVKTAKLLQQ